MTKIIRKYTIEFFGEFFEFKFGLDKYFIGIVELSFGETVVVVQYFSRSALKEFIVTLCNSFS